MSRKKSIIKNNFYSNQDIVTIAIYRLGGAIHRVHLEDVAMKSFKLSPKKFCWKKYPEQINLEAVRVTLKNEMALSNRRVIGSIREGWMLTAIGLQWCLNNLDRDPVLYNQMQYEIDQAKKTSAFNKANNKKRDVTIAEVESLLRVNEYFTTSNRKERVLSLTNVSLLDSELHSVLDILKKQGFTELEVEK